MNILQTLIAARCAGAVLSVLAAAHLAANSLDGWGWFLFVALCFIPSYQGKAAG